MNNKLELLHSPPHEVALHQAISYLIGKVKTVLSSEEIKIISIEIVDRDNFALDSCSKLYQAEIQEAENETDEIERQLHLQNAHEWLKTFDKIDRQTSDILRADVTFVLETTAHVFLSLIMDNIDDIERELNKCNAFFTSGQSTANGPFSFEVDTNNNVVITFFLAGHTPGLSDTLQRN